MTSRRITQPLGGLLIGTTLAVTAVDVLATAAGGDKSFTYVTSALVLVLAAYSAVANRGWLVSIPLVCALLAAWAVLSVAV
jgi:xanthine/uracil permease